MHYYVRRAHIVHRSKLYDEMRDFYIISLCIHNIKERRKNATYIDQIDVYIKKKEIPLSIFLI